MAKYLIIAWPYCEKTKTRRLGWVGFSPSSFLEKRSERGRHRMCSTFVKPRCTGIPTSFDLQHFRQVSMRSTFVKQNFCFLILTASDTRWCNPHMTCATGVFHIHVCTMIILTLAVHVFCEHAITDTVHSVILSKPCLILKNRYLVRFSSNFQERLLMPSS